MDSTNFHLDQLRSTDKATRLRACKALLHAPCLSQEAIYALGLATLDADPAVARSARFTLFIQRFRTNKIAPPLAWTVGIAAILVVLWLLYGDILKTTILTCEREKPGAAVNCSEQPYYFHLIRLPEREIRDVHGVNVLTIVDSEDGELYNLELVTARGRVELSSGYSYHYAFKRGMADQIEDLINDEAKTRLVIDDPGFLTWVDAFICIGFPLILGVAIALFKGLSIIWNRLKSARHPAEPARQSYFTATNVPPASPEPRIVLQKKFGSASRRAVSSRPPSTAEDRGLDHYPNSVRK